MNKKVLMVAFHMPPSSLSSGHLRPLGFAKYMSPLGWDSIILSASERAYPRIDPTSTKLVPDYVPVYRAFAIDVQRHFSVKGRYPSFLAQPDRWSSWWPMAVWMGLRLIRRHDVQAIWSTYPLMTAHCVAYTLSRLTGLPWIADFRDPVATSVARANKLTVSTQMRWERRVVSRAAYTVLTTPGSMRSYAERYPESDRLGHLKVIPNGYDEDDFVQLPAYQPPKGERPLHFVHAGVLYPAGRNPVPFFEALSALKHSGLLGPRDVKITLRASGSEGLYAAEISRLALGDMVTLACALPYHEALAEQAQSDALLLFQGNQFDRHIPAKLYEYLRIGRPIFALVGSQGDTATLLRNNGCSMLVPPEDSSSIRNHLVEFVGALRAGYAAGPSRDTIYKYSRRQGARMLADLLDQLAKSKAGHRGA